MRQMSMLFRDTQRSPRALVVLLGLAVVVLALASCTVSAAQQPAAQPAATSAPAPTAAPVQASSQSVTSSVENFASTPQEVTVSFSPPPSASYLDDGTPHGRVVLALAEGGQYTQNVETFVIKGTWKATGDQIEFTQTSEPNCAGMQGTTHK